MNEWLKIKILKDSKNIYNYLQIFTPSTGLKYVDNNNIFTEEYKKLLNLISNINQGEKVTLSKLNKIDIKLLIKICNYNNVKIINLPIFCIYDIIENKISRRTRSVSSYNSGNNILEFFELFNNTKYKIYLYTIDNNIIRSYIDIDDKEYIRLIRNKKIEKIEKS